MIFIIFVVFLIYYTSKHIEGLAEYSVVINGEEKVIKQREGYRELGRGYPKQGHETYYSNIEEVSGRYTKATNPEWSPNNRYKSDIEQSEKFIKFQSKNEALKNIGTMVFGFFLFKAFQPFFRMTYSDGSMIVWIMLQIIFLLIAKFIFSRLRRTLLDQEVVNSVRAEVLAKSGVTKRRRRTDNGYETTEKQKMNLLVKSSGNKYVEVSCTSKDDFRKVKIGDKVHVFETTSKSDPHKRSTTKLAITL